MSKIKRMGISDRVFYICSMIIALGALVMAVILLLLHLSAIPIW